MRDNFYKILLTLLLALPLNGCALLLAGAVGGAGTSLWLSNKLVQEVDEPFPRSIKASKSALKSLKLKLIQETQKEEVTQLRSEYFDGKAIWIDIHRLSDVKSRIEIRVGISGDEVAARKILEKIERYL